MQKNMELAIVQGLGFKAQSLRFEAQDLVLRV